MTEINVVLDQGARLFFILVQAIAGLGVIVGMVVAVWSLKLQRKETVRQNQRIIELLEEIVKHGRKH